MSAELVESIARAICRRSRKVHFNDDGVVDHTGCSDDLNCHASGRCEEKFALLRCTTHWQTARETIAAIEASGSHRVAPVEPTEEMLKAGFAKNRWRNSAPEKMVGAVTLDPAPAYRAMLSAAPKPG